MLDSDKLVNWLAIHHTILNPKFLPITALINRSTYHKSGKGSEPPCPQKRFLPEEWCNSTPFTIALCVLKNTGSWSSIYNLSWISDVINDV